MTLLTACWSIIESTIIPNGLVKWFYLSFYIHPIFLFLCQIFLWVKLLQRFLLFIVSLPTRAICTLGSCILRCLRKLVVFFFPVTRSNNAQVVEDVNKVEVPLQISNEDHAIHSNNCLGTASIVYKLYVSESQTGGPVEEIPKQEGEVLHEDEPVEDHDLDSDENMDMMGCISFVCSSNSPTTNVVDMNVSVPSLCGSSSAAMERVVDDGGGEGSDSFYKKYAERMKWFDVLICDKACGISAIQNKQVGNMSSLESIEPVDFTNPRTSFSKVDRKRLLRSFKGDFELVYVAQSCLSWEALHHQYQKVEALIACSDAENGFFYGDVAGKFQNFQVLLDRFMEDERCYQGKRHWSYVQRRLSLNSLLQVPEASGHTEEEKGGAKGESMNAMEVLKAIEKSIQAFWLFVNTDNKKTSWKGRSSLWTHSPVEDPRDLKLLTDLTKTLQKKQLWLRDLQGKKRCWLKKLTNTHGETQSKEILFTMIDMKLVSRVLKMSTISTSQLKWCRQKLENIKFKEGKVARPCTCSLFPSS